MFDNDLADFYGIKTKVFNQSVKRNIERFSREFMFQLTKEEKEELVTNCDHLEHLKLSPTLPYVFTEQGVAMLFEKSKDSDSLEKSRVSEALEKSRVSEVLEISRVSEALGKSEVSEVLGKSEVSEALGKSEVSEALGKSEVSEALGKSEVSEALEETVIHKKNK